jgi:hypothetical protein
MMMRRKPKIKKDNIDDFIEGAKADYYTKGER